MTTRSKVIGLGTGLVIFSALFLGFTLIYRHQDELRTEMLNRGRTLLETLSPSCVSALGSGRIEDIDRVINQFMEASDVSSEVESVAVLDRNNRVLSHSNKQLYSRFLQDPFSRSAASRSEVLVQYQTPENADSMRMSMPLITAVGNLPGIRWGTLILTLSTERFDQSLNSVLAHGISVVVVIALLSALILVYYLKRLFLEPISVLTTAARTLQQGNLSARTRLTGGSEWDSLGKAFDSMAEELQKHSEELTMLVEERTRTLHQTNTQLRDALAQLELANRSLQEQARTDPLTGLFNRRHLIEMLQHHIALAFRGGRPLSLLMIDVDHFKVYNDTNGHLFGDAVLKDLAQLLVRRLRKTDLASRFGGEEFAIMLPETEAKHAVEVAQELRQLVESYQFPHANTQPMGRITISVGVALFNPSMGVPDDLIRLADKALYDAKSRGRNQTVLLLGS